MKIRYALLLISIFFSGCITSDPSGIALLRLDSIQDPKSPSIRKEIIDGTEFTMAKRGLWLAEPEALPSLVVLVSFYHSHGAWPEIEQTGNKIKTRIQNHGNYLKLVFPEGKPFTFSYLDKDGYMSIDPKYERLMRDIDQTLTQPQSSMPPILIPAISK